MTVFAGTSTGAATSDDKRIAVVVIHGMGEAKPMQTLRGFVTSIWQHDRSLFRDLGSAPDHKPWDVWSKPDQMSGSAELRRLTTARARDPRRDGEKGKRVDFFELHWADLTADNTWGDFTRWLSALLRRNPFLGEVPPRVLPLWCLLWLLVIVLALSALATAWLGFVKALGSDHLAHTAVGDVLAWPWWPAVAAVSGVLGQGTKTFLTRYFGDVARYVSAAPRNIGVRREARQRGLKLLHELAASHAYDRIIIVGHSLGSVLAHDLVMLAWSEASRSIVATPGSALFDAMRACEAAADELLGAADYRMEELPFTREDRGAVCRYARDRADPLKMKALLAKYRQTQRALFNELARTPARIGDRHPESAWLISDLITVGSPLTHAEFLIARTLCELRAAITMREAMRCPPVLEADENLQGHFSFESPEGSANRQPHHAAAMAPVRWTNIYDLSTPWRFWLGDLVSGPIGRDFGPGVADVPVRIARPGGALKKLLGSRVFTHTLYWTDFFRGLGDPPPAPDHVQALREAVNFLDEDATERRLVDRAVPDVAR